MKRSDVKELYYICPIRNLLSICTHGIFSHNEAKKKHPDSVADPIIQERRKGVKVPGIYKDLHDYANLYFNARNPMMYKVMDQNLDVCVLSIDPNILDTPNVIMTDGNASSNYRRFYNADNWGLANLDENIIYARDWTHSDIFEYWRRKRCICAEVLVPTIIPVNFIQAIYVPSVDSQQKVLQIIGSHPLSKKVLVNADLFFR